MTSLDNNKIRNYAIWTPFEYYGSYNADQETERAVVFGLYSNGWRNDETYISGVSDIELANILSDYNMKISELSNEETKLLSDISAKRYVAGIDGLIHQEKMDTKLQKINADADEWDAKIAALSADRAALETLRVKIETEKKRVAARILELEAHILTEKAHFELVRVEISEKEIQLATKDLQLVEKELEESRKDLAILQVANEIAQVQLKIVEAGLELVDVDMKVARTNVDIAQTENQIIRAGLTESELDVAIARTDAERSELSVMDSRVTLAGMQVDSVTTEIANVASETEDETASHTAKLVDAGAKQLSRLQAITERTERTVFGVKEREVSATLDKDISTKANELQSDTDADKMRNQDAQVDAARTALYAAVAAEQLLAEANIVSTLTHTIKRA